MNKIRFNSPVVLGFAFISACALAAGYLTHGQSNILLFSVYKGSFKDPLFYVRLFTHVFGHANISHYSNNMILLLLVGPLLEEKYGSKKILSIILITAAVTGIFNYVFFWNVALCGASGVVFAFILLTSFTSFKNGEIPLTFILVAVVFIGQQIYEGVMVQDDISNLSHIIGGIIGAVVGYRLNKKA